MRWTGPFPTANVAGMELAMLLSISILCIACLRKLIVSHKMRPATNTVLRTKTHGIRKMSLYRLCLYTSCALCMLSAITVAILLISTGSRAGTLSAISGITFLSCVKYIPWKTSLSLITVLLLCTLFAPFQHRYASMRSDSSVAIRLTLWSAAINVIEDHPIHGLGASHASEIMNNWYLPPNPDNYRLGSVLNDPLTLATRSGLPAFYLYISIVTSALLLGFWHARKRNFLACLGASILIPHVISGQFQAHLLSNWMPISACWIAGILLCCCGKISTLHLKYLAIINLALLVFTISLPLLGPLLGNAQWKAEWIDPQHYVVWPRHTATNNLVVCIYDNEAKKDLLSNWRTARLRSSDAVIISESIPAQAWWESLPQRFRVIKSIDKIPPVYALADGDHGRDLWNAWRQDKIGMVKPIISDPSDIPQTASTPKTKTTLSLHLSTLGFLSGSKQKIRAGKSDQAEIHLHRQFSASWWLRPELD